MKIIMDPRRFVSAALIASALVSSACLGGLVPKPATPAPPAPPTEAILIEGRDAEFQETCAALYRADRGLDIDGETAADCLDRCRRGATGEEIAAWLTATRPAAPTPEPGPAPETVAFPISVSGEDFVDARGALFVPRLESLLTALAVPASAQRAAITSAKARGANGVRIFGGHLDWAAQTAASARERMPAFFALARELGMVVEVAIVTDSRPGGYDVEAHVIASLRIIGQFDNVLPEIANEFFHGTQVDLVQDADALCTLARRAIAASGYRGPWALGAAAHDGLTAGTYLGGCGTFSVAHTQRSRDKGRMLERVYALLDIKRATGKPVISSEPIGADEQDKPGSRVASPAFFRDYAALLQQAGVGGVFHSEDGLRAKPLRAKQQASARAFRGELARSSGRGTLRPLEEGWDSCIVDEGKNPKAIIACNRGRYGRMSRARVAELLLTITQDLNRAQVDGYPFGRLLKTGGNVCGSYSCDILCAGNGPAQRQWDVLKDAEGTASPVWSELTTKKIRTCEAVR